MRDASALHRLGRVALAVLLCGGCSPALKKTVHPQPGLTLSALAIYPFSFRWEEPAYRSFELSHRLLEVAQKKVGDELCLFGPSEFKLLRAFDDNAWAASNLVTLLPGTGVAPESAAVLKAWAERGIASQQGLVLDKKGKPMGRGVAQETTYVGHVAIVHPSTRQVLVEVVGQVKVDPFAALPEDDFDPTPQLTALMEQLTLECLKAISDYASPPGPPRDLGLTLAFNPKAALTYSEESRPSLEVKLAAMDPLESELFLHSRIRFANPALPDAELSKLARLEGGLYVSAAKGEKLAAGDLIVAVDGQPALPQVLQRRRFAAQPIQLKVLRASGERVEVALP